MLVLVLAVLTVSYASSLRAYLQQRPLIGDLKAQIAEREASINDARIEEGERLFHWPLGPRPADHPGLSELGL